MVGEKDAKYGNMLNYTKKPVMALDFNIAVIDNGLLITSKQIDMKLVVPELPDNALYMMAQAAYTFCRVNDIPLDGDNFVVTACEENLEKGGNMQGVFLPPPEYRRH